MLVPIESERRSLPADAGSSGALTDTDFRGCRWIEGEPTPLRRGMFCGRPVPEGESWCSQHRGVVFGEQLESAGDARERLIHERLIRELDAMAVRLKATEPPGA
jgi:hypothetical protein